jgi:hypothetical protein
MAFRWASIATGVKESEEVYRQRTEAEDAKKQAEDAKKQAEDAKKQAEDAGLKPIVGLKALNSPDRDLPPKRVGTGGMVVPKGVNWRAADFAERFLWQCREKCLSCLTVKALKEVFEPFYVDYLLSCYGPKYLTAFNIWRGLSGNPEVTYTTLQRWAKDFEKSFENYWYNKTYIFVHHVTFEAVLWALSTAAGAFRTDNVSEITTGFLKVADFKERKEEAPILWVVTDIEEYQSTPRIADKTAFKLVEDF